MASIIGHCMHYAMVKRKVKRITFGLSYLVYVYIFNLYGKSLVTILKGSSRVLLSIAAFRKSSRSVGSDINKHATTTLVAGNMKKMLSSEFVLVR